MNFSDAIAEPFVNYIEFHNAFNRSVKVATAALHGLIRDTETEAGIARVGELIRDCGEPWGAMRFRNPKRFIEDSVPHIASLWVVRVFSAFEWFLVQTNAEVDRWNSRAQKVESGEMRDEHGDISLNKLYQAHGWDQAGIAGLRQSFGFFQELRNCVAHRGGLASIGLAGKAISAELQQELSKPLSSSRKSPRPTKQMTLPAVTLRQLVPTRPRDAILASAVCFRIAEDVNRRLVEKLQEDGIVNMAAFHAVLAAEHPARKRNHKLPEVAINDFLFRYKMRGIKSVRTIAVLKDLGIWKRVRDRHGEVLAQA
jgi:hypothetical protein